MGCCFPQKASFSCSPRRYLEEYSYGKISQTVKASILELIGKFSEKFRHQVTEQSEKLRCLYLETLRSQFSSKKPDMSVIAAALSGLRGLLKSYPGDFVAGNKNVVVCEDSVFIGG